MRLLSGRAHSRLEMQRKLGQRGYSPEDIEAALKRLDELGYLEVETPVLKPLYREMLDRVGNKLLRLGFSTTIVRGACRAVISGTPPGSEA